jgi:hypothetical protein
VLPLATSFSAAASSLRHHRVVASIALVLLASAIAMHSLAFALFSAHLLRGPRIDDVRRLVMMGETHGTAYSGPVHYGTFVAWRDAATTIRGMALGGHPNPATDGRLKTGHQP